MEAYYDFYLAGLALFLFVSGCYLIFVDEPWLGIGLVTQAVVVSYKAERKVL